MPQMYFFNNYFKDFHKEKNLKQMLQVQKGLDFLFMGIATLRISQIIRKVAFIPKEKR
jgi:hypothetical protein